MGTFSLVLTWNKQEIQYQTSGRRHLAGDVWQESLPSWNSRFGDWSIFLLLAKSLPSLCYLATADSTTVVPKPQAESMKTTCHKTGRCCNIISWVDNQGYLSVRHGGEAAGWHTHCDNEEDQRKCLRIEYVPCFSCSESILLCSWKGRATGRCSQQDKPGPSFSLWGLI